MKEPLKTHLAARFERDGEFYTTPVCGGTPLAPTFVEYRHVTCRRCLGRAGWAIRSAAKKETP